MGLVAEGTIERGRERGCGAPAARAAGGGVVQSGWPQLRSELAGKRSKTKIISTQSKIASPRLPAELCVIVEARN